MLQPGYKMMNVIVLIFSVLIHLVSSDTAAVRFYKNMNWLTLSAVVIMTALSAAELYTDRYDDLNVVEIIENRRLLVAYLKCVLEKGRCTAEGKELRRFEPATVTLNPKPK